MQKIIIFCVGCMVSVCAHGYNSASMIDAVDKNGDTELCVAIKNGDISKYNLLKESGANTQHDCVNKISTQQYQHFMAQVAAGNKTWSFLGLGKWAWGAIGVAAITGGAVAISGGSGSGGSGSGDGQKCSYGYVFDGNMCEFDAINYIEQNGQVYLKLNCVHGVQTGNTCTCFYGYVFDGNICTFDAANYIEQNGQVYLKLNCGIGTQVGNACVNSTETVIDNTGFPNTTAHGIWVYSGGASAINTVSGKITIKNTYQSYGLRVSGSALNAVNHGKIYIDNTDLTNAIAYGINVGVGASATNTETGEIRITNTNGNEGYSVGIYAIDSMANNNGIISVENTNGNFSMGMFVGAYSQGVGELNVINNGTITIKNAQSGAFHIGISGQDSNVRDLIITNNGTITIENISGTSGVASGIHATNAIVTNNGTIAIDGTESVTYGIYASDSIVTNAGNIVITNTNDNLTIGIFATGSSTIVRNTGTISINGDSCIGNICNGYSNNHIRLVNGATFVNSGLMSAPQMNLNSMGGNVVAGFGSQFVVENELSGDLNISSELVQNGNQTTYIAENMIDAGDVSGLNVRSASAMFNVSLADNRHDVVMQMKDFNELTNNKSLATFLANNYANGNGSDLFATLKSMDNMSAFNATLSGLTGLNTFTQFAHKDLSVMREIGFSMTNKLFENSNRDSFCFSDDIGHFSFSDRQNNGSGRYVMSGKKISDNWNFGYGMARANINTNENEGFYRQNETWMFYMPATYSDEYVEIVAVPQVGFTNSQYTRSGYNNINYEGHIAKRMVGLTNDLRYPLTIDNWVFAPDFALNTIVYTQSGHEDIHKFSLIIPDDKMISIETGLGLYSKYENIFANGGHLKFTSGVMGYREYGDTYNIKLGIRDMDGSFYLYNNDYKYRGALNAGVSYEIGNLHLYGNTQYFMDNANYINFNGGISYRF